MARPVKDYWNWPMITVPYNGDWRSLTDAEHFLRDNTRSRDHYQIFASSDYPKPRRKHAHKVYTAFHYHIKDPGLATFFQLRFAK